ncbi:hypothetical protein [Paenibacillus lemnae]|uniref:Uncharacterized protein n=1 Tax=Paenibacillus lemnae TaxID=1330551 RepID=A0A848M6R4_PAELE|nr:hypothetical protein [Paenibacillus lemnae]NMO96326.1 hypothetical protein [Paenibacillus lemnae]
MQWYKRMFLFLIMYGFSVYLLYIAALYAPYLLPVIWFTALTLLICGLCYVFCQHLSDSRKKRSR